jgi:hypothetical protein
MTLSTRTLAALAIATSTVSGVLYGATVAYATHIDSGHGLVHGHRTDAHTSRSQIRWQFPAYLPPAYLRQFPAHLRCTLCAWRQPGEW